MFSDEGQGEGRGKKGDEEGVQRGMTHPHLTSPPNPPQSPPVPLFSSPGFNTHLSPPSRYYRSITGASLPVCIPVIISYYCYYFNPVLHLIVTTVTCVIIVISVQFISKGIVITPISYLLTLLLFIVFICVRFYILTCYLLQGLVILTLLLLSLCVIFILSIRHSLSHCFVRFLSTYLIHFTNLINTS